MAQIQVGFGSVLGDEDLAVLERAHGAGIDVDVRVELGQRDLEAAGLQDGGQGRGRDAFAQGRDDTAGDENVLGHWRKGRVGSGRPPHRAMEGGGMHDPVGTIRAFYPSGRSASSRKRVNIKRKGWSEGLTVESRICFPSLDGWEKPA